MLIRPPPQVLRPSPLGGRVAGQAFGFPHAGPQAQPPDTGGGGGGYVAKAVHFWDGVTDNQKSYVSSDTMTGIGAFDKVTAFGWFREDVLAFDNTALITGPVNGGPLYFGNEINSTTDFGFVATGNQDSAGKSFTMDSNDGVFTTGIWHPCFVSYDLSHPAGQKIGFVYVDGASVANPALTVDANDAFSIDWGVSSTPSLSIPDINGFFTGSDGPIMVADVQIWLGQCIDPSDPANLAKFISGGKPVDPAIAAAAFGQQTFLFSGDHTSFVNNQGSWQGTSFSLTGPLTNATTSPSD